MSKKTSKLVKDLKAWCKEFDIMIRQDVIDGKRGTCQICRGKGCAECDEGEIQLQPDIPCCWLSTLHDPSVGIDGTDLSPLMRTIGGLADWFHRNRKTLEGLLEDATVSSASFQDAAKHMRAMK